MERKAVATRYATRRCYECLNFMKVKLAENGSYFGKCPVCHSSVFVKQHSEKERHIKVICNNIAN